MGITAVIDTDGGIAYDLSGLSTDDFGAVAAWVEFDAAGMMSGEGPCNGFQGSYTVEDGELEIDEASSQMQGCRDRVNAAEEVILRPLVASHPVLSITRDGSAVVLDDGETMLLLEPIAD